MTSELATIRPSNEPAVSIMETDDGPDPKFLHAVLCQVSLPRNPTKESMFTRSSGRVSITLQAGPLFDGIKMVPQPLPSGTRPRLVLLHICTTAVKTRSPDIAIGQSVRGFLRELGIDAGGENMRQFRAQMKALAACHMILGAPSPDGPVTLSAKPVERFAAWTTDDEGQYVAWNGRLVLGAQFYESLIAHAAEECRRVACGLGAEVHEGKGAMTVDVGLAIQAAINRGEAHRALSQRQLRVKLFNYPQGLAIVVTIPARDNGELAALNAGTRVIPWRDLSRRAHELPDIVDECVTAVEPALGLRVAA
jgi:Plasmid encoded RepA protein